MSKGEGIGGDRCQPNAGCVALLVSLLDCEADNQLAKILLSSVRPKSRPNLCLLSELGGGLEGDAALLLLSLIFGAPMGREGLGFLTECGSSPTGIRQSLSTRPHFTPSTCQWLLPCTW